MAFRFYEAIALNGERKIHMACVRPMSCIYPLLAPESTRNSKLEFIRFVHLKQMRLSFAIKVVRILSYFYVCNRDGSSHLGLAWVLVPGHTSPYHHKTLIATVAVRGRGLTTFIRIQFGMETRPPHEATPRIVHLAVNKYITSSFSTPYLLTNINLRTEVGWGVVQHQTIKRRR